MDSIRIAVAIVLVLVAEAPLAAQAIQSPYEFIETRHSVTGFAGWLSTQPGRIDLGPRPAPVFGARYDIHFTGPLYGEVALGMAPSERTIFSATAGTQLGEPEPVAETSALLLLAEAGLRFNLTGPRTYRNLAPYLAASLGLAADLSGSHPVERDLELDELVDFGPAFAAGLGLGSDYFLSERLSIRAEVRDYLWRLSRPVAFTTTGRSESEWRHNFAFTLGASYHF